MLLVVVALVLLVQAVLQVGRVTERAAALHEDVASARTSLIAETSLIHWLDSPDEKLSCTVAGQQVSVHQRKGRIDLEIASAHAVTNLFARRLDGGAPQAFSHARVACDAATLDDIGGGMLVDAGSWPAFDAEEIGGARCVSEMAGFHRDPEIALQYLQAGTDRADFVWHASDLLSGAEPNLLRVPGNLWIESGAEPFVCDLPADLVLMVDGNLHLLRSLQVTGPGRLLVVCRGCEGVVFCDRDGSGGWSTGDVLRAGDEFSGPVEGAGSVYLGLPGVAEGIECHAGLMVFGELHVAGSSAVHGPLLLRNGVTSLPQSGDPGDSSALRLPGPGQWTFRRGRERIPGFAVRGPARPGRIEIRSR